MQSTLIVFAVASLAIPLCVTGIPTSVTAATGPDAGVIVLAQAGQSLEKRTLEPAPMPERLDPRVAPADRAGSSETPANGAGPVDSTPFSGAPTDMDGGGSPAERADRAGNGGVTVPNLGR